MNISVVDTQPNSRITTMVIEGDLIIRDSHEIKEALLNLLENYQDIDIQLKNIERIDITALQLLAALSGSALKQGKIVKYSFEETEYISTVLNNSGFNKLFQLN